MTVEVQLAAAYPGVELTQPERQPRVEGALAQRHQVTRRPEELREGLSERLSFAESEQILRGGIEIGHPECCIEREQCGRQTLENAVRIGRPEAPSRGVANVSAGPRERRGAGRQRGFGVWMLVC